MNGRDHGFTLLEVLVALAILSVAVVASIQGFAQGLRLLKLSGDHQRAMLLADQKAREIVTPIEGRDEGQDEQSGTTFTWETVTTPVEAPDLIPTTGTGTPLWRVYQIVVHVRWAERRHVEVATLRTAAIPSQEVVVPAGTQPSPVGAPGAGTPGATVGTPGAPGAGSTGSRPVTTVPRR